MKLETMKADSKEIFLDAGYMSVTINTWANHEGASIMVHGKGPELPLRMAGAFRWEELDAIMVALKAAKVGTGEMEHAWICPRCKADRFKEDCKGDRMSCPMVGVAHNVDVTGAPRHGQESKR